MDYRQCEYEAFSYNGISEAKYRLGCQIDSRARSRHGDHYNKINDKQSEYYQIFEEVYHNKCAYCGIITAIHPSASFEIDHFVNKLQEELPNGENINHVSNLVFACRNCNQSKKALHVNNVIEELDPDGAIKKVFTRETDYSITINDDFKSNSDIQKFYRKLRFSSSFRRMDYLLLNLYYMKNCPSRNEAADALSNLFTELLTLRNRQPSLLKKQDKRV